MEGKMLFRARGKTGNHPNDKEGCKGRLDFIFGWLQNPGVNKSNL
jgi:hypothetical protein